MTSFSRLYQTGLVFTDILICLSYFRFHVESTEGLQKYSADIDYYLDSELEISLSLELQTVLIQLFLVKEFQLTELKGNAEKLDREETEAVNFTQFSVMHESMKVDEEGEETVDESKITKVELELCTLTSRLIILSQIGLIDQTHIDRLKLNSDVLGPLFLGTLKLNDPPKPKRKKAVPRPIKPVTPEVKNESNRSMVPDDQAVQPPVDEHTDGNAGGEEDANAAANTNEENEDGGHKDAAGTDDFELEFDEHTELPDLEKDGENKADEKDDDENHEDDGTGDDQNEDEDEAVAGAKADNDDGGDVDEDGDVSMEGSEL
ncbi:unnamed protein product [Ambrosiozyma monospora]|uniref:Unnamed protein product n=1 Tax=Ambrosiozyma monospora TaxID=43982 RepID=A0ACB5TBG8_AMBMO|nr:unnamed protein product [Ambrosiozyma monospora]